MLEITEITEITQALVFVSNLGATMEEVAQILRTFLLEVTALVVHQVMAIVTTLTALKLVGIVYLRILEAIMEVMQFLGALESTLETVYLKMLEQFLRAVIITLLVVILLVVTLAALETLFLKMLE